MTLLLPTENGRCVGLGTKFCGKSAHYVIDGREYCTRHARRKVFDLARDGLIDWVSTPKPAVPHCEKVVQQDEYFCAPCGLRWDRHEEAPPCPRLKGTT